MNDRLLTCGQVCELLSISKSKLYRMVNDGIFPAPLPLGKRSARWRSGDLDAFIEGLVVEAKPRERGDTK